MNEFSINFSSVESAIREIRLVEAMIRSQEEETGRIRNGFHSDFRGKGRILQNLRNQMNTLSRLGDNAGIFENSLNSILDLYSAAEQQLLGNLDVGPAVPSGALSPNEAGPYSSDDLMDWINRSRDNDRNNGWPIGLTIIAVATLGPGILNRDNTTDSTVPGRGDAPGSGGGESPAPDMTAVFMPIDSDRQVVPVPDPVSPTPGPPMIIVDPDVLEPFLPAEPEQPEEIVPEPLTWEEFISRLPEGVLEILSEDALEYLHDLFDFIRYFRELFGDVRFLHPMSPEECAVWGIFISLILTYFERDGLNPEIPGEAGDPEAVTDNPVDEDQITEGPDPDDETSEEPDNSSGSNPEDSTGDQRGDGNDSDQAGGDESGQAGGDEPGQAGGDNSDQGGSRHNMDRGPEGSDSSNEQVSSQAEGDIRRTGSGDSQTGNETGANKGSNVDNRTDAPEETRGGRVIKNPGKATDSEAQTFPQSDKGGAGNKSSDGKTSAVQKKPAANSTAGRNTADKSAAGKSSAGKGSSGHKGSGGGSSGHKGSGGGGGGGLPSSDPGSSLDAGIGDIGQSGSSLNAPEQMPDASLTVDPVEDPAGDYLASLIGDRGTVTNGFKNWTRSSMSSWGNRAAEAMSTVGGSPAKASAGFMGSTAGKVAGSVACAAVVDAGIGLAMHGAGALGSVFGAGKNDIFESLDYEELI